MKTKIIAFTVFLFLNMASSFSQSFGDKHTLATGGINELKAVHASDIDNDGDMDMLVADKQRDHILLYENLGNAEFAFEKTIGMMNWPVDVSTSDVDHDGDMDLIWAAWGGRKLAWNENLGDGLFGNEKTISTTIQEIHHFEMHDMDGDGFEDILFNATDSNKLSWVKNLGDNTFGNPVQLLSEHLVISFCCKDIDLDADLDILYSEKETGKSAWLVNDGNGGFSEERVIFIDSINNADGSGVYIFDSDNDGDNDLVIGSVYDSVRIFFNNGQNIFSDTVKLIKNQQFTQVKSFDFDNDLDEDLIFVGERFFSSFTILENIDGTHFIEKHITTPKTLNKNFFIYDMNNDSLQDIVFGCGFFRYVGWLENSTDHFFEDKHFISSQLPSPNSMATRDFNNDGSADIFLGSYNFPPAIFVNSGKGVFSGPLRAPRPHRYPDNYLFDDFNGDGYSDILSYSYYYSDSVHFIFEINNHDSTFEIINNENLNKSYRKLFLADYNSDSINEIIAVDGYTFITIYFIKCSDSLQFSIIDSVTIPLNADEFDISFADFNNDNDKDILVVDYQHDIISIVYAENGSFNPSPDTINSEFTWLFNVIPANINSDSYTDLAYTANYQENGWLENIPGVGFVKHPFNLGKSFYNVFAIDINNDDVDELLIDRYDNLYLIKDIGDDDFTLEEYEYSSKIRGAVITDIDYDGDDDFISYSLSNSECAWFENLYLEVSVELPTTEAPFRIYPNPTRGSFTVRTTFNSPSLTIISLYNNLGKKVKSSKLKPSTNQFTINTNNLSPGVYYLSIETENSFYSSKVLILE